MTERRRLPRFATRTFSSEHLTVRGHPHRVISRSELLARAALRPEQLARIERQNLVRPLGASTREAYYPHEALALLERIQTLIAAGYAERDVAHVVGRVAAATLAPIERVIELDPAASKELTQAGLIPLWGVTEAGQPLVNALHLPLCEALIALRVLGLGELVPTLSSAVTDANPTALTELRRSIEHQLDSLDTASALLRKHLTRLAPHRVSRVRGLRRLLRRRGPKA